MSDRPSIQHVLTAVKDVATEWHDLGIYLGLAESMLKLIGSSPDIEGHLRMMVSKWLDYDPEASWDKLANALNIMGKNTIASNIRSKYVGAAATAIAISDRPSTLTLQHILTVVRDVATEWHDLGIYLGLPESMLKLIGSSPDIEGRLRMMVSKWLDYDPEASWDKLANALNIMGMNTIASNIRSKYVGAAATALDVTNTTSDDDSKTRMFKYQ